MRADKQLAGSSKTPIAWGSLRSFAVRHFAESRSLLALENSSATSRLLTAAGRLEINLSRRKHRSLRISNRPYRPISISQNYAPSRLLVTHRSSLIRRFLIATLPTSEIQSSSTKQTLNRFSNRNNNAISRGSRNSLDFTHHSLAPRKSIFDEGSLVTSHSSLATGFSNV
jgi:hypothetical protein